jgi:hypothetical protein
VHHMNTRTPSSFGIGASQGEACKAMSTSEPLLPSRRHCRAAELEVLERAQRFHRPINELHNIHLGHRAIGIKSPGYSVMGSSGGSNLCTSLMACRTLCFSRKLFVIRRVRLE